MDAITRSKDKRTHAKRTELKTIQAMHIHRDVPPLFSNLRRAATVFDLTKAVPRHIHPSPAVNRWQLNAPRHARTSKRTFRSQMLREAPVMESADKSPAVEAPSGGKGKDKKGAKGKGGGKAAAAAAKIEDSTPSSGDKKSEGDGDPRQVRAANFRFVQCWKNCIERSDGRSLLR